MAIAYSQAELALRFRERQDMLPRCVGCGAPIKRGQGVCADCEKRRAPLGAAASRPRLHAEPALPARIRATPRYKPKPCKEPSCRQVFTPTGRPL
jgi:predicted amidophosphoribosyltransferase